MTEMQVAKSREFRLRTIIRMFENDKKRAGIATKATQIFYEESSKELTYEIFGEKAKIRHVIKNVESRKILIAIEKMI